ALFRSGGVRLRHRAAEPLRRGRLAEDSPGGDRGPVALIPELVYDELSGAGRVTSSTRPYSLASVTSSHRPVWKSSSTRCRGCPVARATQIGRASCRERAEGGGGGG